LALDENSMQSTSSLLRNRTLTMELQLSSEDESEDELDKEIYCAYAEIDKYHLK